MLYSVQVPGNTEYASRIDMGSQCFEGARKTRQVEHASITEKSRAVIMSKARATLTAAHELVHHKA